MPTPARPAPKNAAVLEIGFEGVDHLTTLEDQAGKRYRASWDPGQSSLIIYSEQTGQILLQPIAQLVAKALELGIDIEI